MQLSFSSCTLLSVFIQSLGAFLDDTTVYCNTLSSWPLEPPLHPRDGNPLDGPSCTTCRRVGEHKSTTCELHLHNQSLISQHTVTQEHSIFSLPHFRILHTNCSQYNLFLTDWGTLHNTPLAQNVLLVNEDFQWHLPFSEILHGNICPCDSDYFHMEYSIII